MAKSKKPSTSLTKTETEPEKGMGLEQSSANVVEKENNSNSSKIVEVIPYRHTPFVKVKISDTDVFIAIGNKRVTEIITEDVADKKIKFKDWDLTVSLVTAMTETVCQELLKDYQLKPIDDEIEKLKEKYSKKD